MKLWFDTLDVFTLCRGGGNGPEHPSQLYAILKYCTPGQTFLDFGCGSGTTYEAIQKHALYLDLKYQGIDVIEKNINWCRETFPKGVFKNGVRMNKISKSDKTWDVVFSRHVVDHMDSFENGLSEHCRIAKKLVIIVLWRKLLDADEHDIKHIQENGKSYKEEYSNHYSRKKVLEAIEKQKDFKLLELIEGVGKEILGHDTIIVLKRI